jgi:hypothetical protein
MRNIIMVGVVVVVVVVEVTIRLGPLKAATNCLQAY